MLFFKSPSKEWPMANRIACLSGYQPFPARYSHQLHNCIDTTDKIQTNKLSKGVVAGPRLGGVVVRNAIGPLRTLEGWRLLTSHSSSNSFRGIGLSQTPFKILGDLRGTSEGNRTLERRHQNPMWDPVPKWEVRAWEVPNFTDRPTDLPIRRQKRLDKTLKQNGFEREEPKGCSGKSALCLIIYAFAATSSFSTFSHLRLRASFFQISLNLNRWKGKEVAELALPWCWSEPACRQTGSESTLLSISPYALVLVLSAIQYGRPRKTF